MSKHNVTVERTSRKVIVSKSFMIAAGQYGSEEFKMYQDIKTRYPDYTLEVVSPERKSEDGLLGKMDYKSMKEFIQGHEANEEAVQAVLEEMATVQEFAKGRRGAYLMVKKWFLEKYSDEIEHRKKEKEAKFRVAREKNYLYHPTTSANT